MGKISSITCGLPFCQNARENQTRLSIGLRVTAIALGTMAIIISLLIICDIPGLSHFSATAGWIIFSVGACFVLLGIVIKCIKEKSVKLSNNIQYNKHSHRTTNDQQVLRSPKKTFHHADLIGTAALTHPEFDSSGHFQKVRKRLVEKYNTKDFDQLTRNIYGVPTMFNMYSKSADETNWKEEYIIETVSLCFLSDEEMLRLPLQQVVLYDENQKNLLALRIVSPLKPGNKYNGQIQNGQNPYPNRGESTLSHLLSNMSITDLKLDNILLNLQSLENISSQHTFSETISAISNVNLKIISQ